MLDVITVDNGAGPGDPCVILCHGFGADAADLAPLAREIVLPMPVRWMFPQAPFEFQLNWGTARAWFPRERMQLESFLTGDLFSSLADVEPPGLFAAAEELAELVHASGLEQGKLVIGGFSQGAMVAAAAAVTTDLLPAGLVLFSASIVAATRLTAAARENSARLHNLPVAQYHGSADPVLPFRAGRELESLLRDAGAAVDFVAFDGGHGIPPDVLDDVTPKLAQMLS